MRERERARDTWTEPNDVKKSDGKNLLHFILASRFSLSTYRMPNEILSPLMLATDRAEKKGKTYKYTHPHFDCNNFPDKASTAIYTHGWTDVFCNVFGRINYYIFVCAKIWLSSAPQTKKYHRLNMFYSFL